MKQGRNRLAVLMVVLGLGSYIANAQTSWEITLPTVGTFSSPRVADLTGDGVGDIILGAGREEFKSCDTAVFALDGTDGQLLWKVSARDQIFGSAALHDLDGDGVQDIIINGRSAELKAINGKSGTLLWEFLPDKTTEEARESGWYNFYNPQIIPDQNRDEVADILISNGGDVLAEPYDPNRPAGSLVVISGKDGKLLAQAKMPDGKEIYMSVVGLESKKKYSIVFGTGGETIGGNLFVTELKDVMKGDISDAVKLATSKDKGFIAPPARVDITRDGVPDIVACAVDGRMMAFNGKTLAPLWEVLLPDTEIYSSLTIGKFTKDDIPDFFVSIAQGVWPKLEWNRQFMVDGAKGEIAFQDSLGFYQTSTAVAGDLNGSGYDDVLMSVNYQIFDEIYQKFFQNKLIVVDFKNDKLIELGVNFSGNNISSTPWIGDLDGDNTLEIIYCHGTNTRHTYTFDGLQVHCIYTGLPIQAPIRWGAYMGSNYDGIFPASE